MDLGHLSCHYLDLQHELRETKMTWLTENSMFFLSWLTARGSGTGSVCLITLTDSPVRHKRWGEWEGNWDFFVSLFVMHHLPVRIDWSTRRVVDLIDMILMSAGTLSPTRENKQAWCSCFISVCSIEGEVRVDWLILTLWMDGWMDGVVENWYYSWASGRVRPWGSHKWKEQVYGKQRQRSEVILSVAVSATASKSFLLKDVSLHVCTQSRVQADEATPKLWNFWMTTHFTGFPVKEETKTVSGWGILPETSTTSPGIISLALILCTLFLSAR